MSSPSILTPADLAERWQITPAELARRLPRLGLPATNIGTRRKPEYRFRLTAVEEWEAINECAVGQSEADGHPINAGRPIALEGVDYFKREPRKSRSRPT